MAKTPAVRCPEFDWDFDLTLAKVITLPAARNRVILICSILFILFSCRHGAARLEVCLFRQCSFCHIHREVKVQANCTNTNGKLTSYFRISYL
jgi:hypothetical protein